jgi:hypothetical protein
MTERKISTSDVESILTLTKPDGVLRQSMDKLVHYKKLEARGDNAIDVVAVEQNNGFEVVTVMVNFEVRK